MSKKVVRVMKIQFKAGQAKPGPALAGAGIQMPKFCTAFNDQTKDRMGETVPVVLTVYEDKDFSFVLKTAPASEMIKKALGVQKGSSNAGTTTVGTLSADKLKEIAEYKSNLYRSRKRKGTLFLFGTCGRFQLPFCSS